MSINLQNCAAALVSLGLATACVGDFTADTADTRAKLNGRLLDATGSAVVRAEVSLAVGSVEITPRVRTDAQGDYVLEVPVAEVERAYASSQEVTLLFHSPRTDREPMGTVEGDYVHLLPATLREFANVDALAAGETVLVRDAHVPLQGQGYRLTEELIRDGGTLTWAPEGTQYGEGFRVSLIIEPGSIHRAGDPQDEITLTMLEQDLAPMTIPEDGFGPLWTIQPRDITFNPPARLRIEGQRLPVVGPSVLEVGESTELYGASLETGWKLFGDIEVMEMGENVVLETQQGIISHGAWGHVFGRGASDYGLLVRCVEVGTSNPMPCAILDDNGFWTKRGDTCDDADGEAGQVGNLNCSQIDYHNRHYKLYSSSMEPRCRGCGGSTWARSVLAMGVKAPGAVNREPVNQTVYALAMCPEEQTIADMGQLFTTIKDRYDALHTAAFYDDDPSNDLRYLLPQVDGVRGARFLEDYVDGLTGLLEWRKFNKTLTLYVKPPEGCASN